MGMGMAMAMGSSTSRHYTQARMKEIESFEDQVLSPMARWQQCMAEIEQEEMRLRGRLDRFRVAIRTAQRHIQELREEQMDEFQYPYRRKG